MVVSQKLVGIALLSLTVVTLICVCFAHTVSEHIATIGFTPVASSTPGSEYAGNGDARHQPDFPKFAARVLKPTIAGVVEVDEAILSTALKRMRPTPKSSASTLAHYMHLTNANATVPSGDGAVAIQQLLLNADVGAKHFRQAKPLFRTRYGVRFTAHEKLMLGTDQASAEAHSGQFLSEFATLGIGLSQPIRLGGESSATLQDVFNDLIANFFLDDGEIYWQAVALALYLPPQTSWKNRFGQEFTFDMLGDALINRDLGNSACAGTHRLIALTVLWRVHREVAILGPEAERRIVAELSRTARALVGSQEPDGSWTPAWHVGLTSGSADPAWNRFSMVDRIIATGHHLEWLLLLPQSVRPPDIVFARAARFLMSVVPNLMQDQKWVDDWYCPATHALRSIKLLSAPSESRRRALEEQSRRPIILPHDSTTSTSSTFQSRKEVPAHLRYMIV